METGAEGWPQQWPQLLLMYSNKIGNGISILIELTLILSSTKI